MWHIYILSFDILYLEILYKILHTCLLLFYFLIYLKIDQNKYAWEIFEFHKEGKLKGVKMGHFKHKGQNHTIMKFEWPKM